VQVLQLLRVVTMMLPSERPLLPLPLAQPLLPLLKTVPLLPISALSVSTPSEVLLPLIKKLPNSELSHWMLHGVLLNVRLKMMQ
jgi:hypothetical protein